MKVLYKGPVNAHTGYGTDGIGIAQALTSLGLDVYLDPAHVQAPLPRSVAELLTKRLEPPFDLLLHHTDPGQLGISPGVRRAAKTAVAWTMWEFETLDNCAGRSSLRRRLKDYDAVFGYDEVSTGALREYVPASTPLGTVQGGIWPDHWPAQHRDWHGTFRFAMVGALHQRKDPFIAIQAFKELQNEHEDFRTGAELHLKTVEPGLHRKLEDWAPGLHIHYETWSQPQLRAFYGQTHVLLAPSRGEGKNAPALEMLCTGGTVIATNWGGHRQWLHPGYAYSLCFDLQPISPQLPRCRNARADLDHLKRLMLHVFRNRDDAARKGQMAATVIPAMCGWIPVLERLFVRLADLIPDTGAPLLYGMRRSAAANEQDPSRQPVRTAQVEQYG